MKVYTTQPGLGVGVNLVNPAAPGAVPPGAFGQTATDEENELN